MILEKLRERKRFTNSEKLIAEYVLKHPEQLYQLSVEELGKECDAHSGINEHFILSQKNSRQCVAILISFTGNNSEMIKIAKYLKLLILKILS